LLVLVLAVADEEGRGKTAEQICMKKDGVAIGCRQDRGGIKKDVKDGPIFLPGMLDEAPGDTNQEGKEI